ncbi:helix-turn-helix domain-containing protein [Microbulbifer sp. CnH-101-E]
MSYYKLSENERYQIYSLRKVGHSQKSIAEFLERYPTLISLRMYLLPACEGMPSDSG